MEPTFKVVFVKKKKKNTCEPREQYIGPTKKTLDAGRAIQTIT